MLKIIYGDVDSSIVLDSGAIESPVMGVVFPERLSVGVKVNYAKYQDVLDKAK
jgi:hypothetical protein